jgi:ATP-binding cassette, subfamily B, heavy metal transporter
MARHINPEKEVSNYSSWQLIKDILTFLKPYRGRFFAASVIRLLGDLAWLFPVYALSQIVTFLTHYKPGADLTYVWTLAGLWLLAVVIRSLSQFFSKFLGYRVAEQISVDSVLKTLQHMFLLDMAWHERENSGNKIKRAQNAGEGLNKIIRLWFNDIIEIVVNFVAISLILSRFDTTVLLLLLSFLVTYFIISGVMIRKAGHASYRVNAQEEVVSGLLFEAINNIRTVKVMAMAKNLFAILVKSTEELITKLRVRIFWYQSRNAFLTFWATAWKVGIIVVIITGIVHGRYEVGFLILFNGYFSNMRESIDELSAALEDFVTSKFSVARMKTILNEPITIDDEQGKKPLAQDWNKITFQNVSFAYGENKVLSQVSFDVNRGEKVGIVGLSGAGKSTLFKLLLKEREEFTGDILFDSISLKQIRKSDYFKQVSVVLQDTEVFNFSLRDNITISNTKQKSNQSLLKQALNTAHITDFLHKLPQGLDTVIGEKGVKLSGGERQRLGIARAIFKQPQILLLDEATSHLDLESEEKIQDSLHKFFHEVTAIVIAHRLTTIREMDKILVVENGKIIESGNFNELYKTKGRFYELWEKQRL